MHLTVDRNKNILVICYDKKQFLFIGTLEIWKTFTLEM